MIVSDSFKLNVTLLTLIGLYPPKKPSMLHKLYATILYSLAFLPPLVLGTLHFFFMDDFNDIDFSDFVMIGMISYTFKLMPFVTNSSKVKKCINYFDILNYKVFKSEEKILKACIGSCRRNTNVFFVGCCLSLFGFVAQALLRENPHQLPVKVWFPFTHKEAPVIYYSIYFLLVYGPSYSVLACGTIDPMIGGLAYHAAAQLQILKRNLQYLDEYILDRYLDINETRNIRYSIIYEEIIRCVRRYQEIANFVDLFKDFFSQVVFSQLFGSVFLIGLCCLQIIRMEEMDINFFITINYLWVILFQIFFYCYYGTLLVEENNTLTTSIYLSKWYEYSINEQKALIILMERSKKPMIITAGGILDLSLDTFTTILRRSYSVLCCFK